jgi:predicted RNase H-like HicB family nuclease
MQLTLEVEQETDGRWLAEVPEIPGAIVYGATRAAAMAKAEALALRALAERLDYEEATPMSIHVVASRPL